MDINDAIIILRARMKSLIRKIDAPEREALQMAIGVMEKSRWIPVSERLPDELAEVNITWINTNPDPYYEFIKGKPYTGSAAYYKGRWYWYSAVCVDYLAEYCFSPNDDMDDAIKVIAWMPLPESWKGEKDG